MQFVVEYEIAAVILSLAVLFSFFRKKLVNTRLTRVFFLLVIDVLSMSAIDLIAIELNDHINGKIVWLCYLVNILYYLFVFIVVGII